ncbi:ATP phosphoribosyltransferase [Vulcanisaeta distributa]|uniref:ATP phosphoribosyltransferase n=1 Tax=Vulcanisaeta distributa (strain DSM 14429 / JCM 11212 / NBRC 100878 / IC-017) TaxID=572478 RepID=E1QV72_VULDI|nr:ATP phosphoribosyltransferase [Vulcanisaeta distributa]ADN49999.1 ATP phosphoribosyltransferase [Vulcanisaeta distributa DSM 14429]
MAIPSKGRLVQPTIKLLEDVGIRLQVYDDRALMIPTNWSDLNIIRVRPEDIPYIVESSAAVMGITGLDYVVESQSRVKVVERLGFGNGKIVVAVPSTSGINSINDMEDGIRVATKYVNLTMNYFKAYGKNVRIVRISGSAEIMPLLGVAEAIVDVMSTGTTLKIHGLKPIGVITETEAVLITSNTGFDKCGEVMERFLLLLRGVKSSINKKLVLMNVPTEYLSKVLSILPAMEGPTVADIANKPFKEVISVVPENELPSLLVKLKNAGAKDILVMSIEKVIA